MSRLLYDEAPKERLLYVYPAKTPGEPIVHACEAAARRAGWYPVAFPSWADVAVAPLLETKLDPADLAAPKRGTLVFHPSLLPRYRGRNAIRAAFEAGDRYSGATWFWAADKMDAGDICEQEVLEIVPGERPREFYSRAVVPSAALMLERLLGDLGAGHVRKRPQRTEAASYVPVRVLN